MSVRKLTLTWCNCCGAMCWLGPDSNWACKKCGARGNTERRQWEQEPICYVAATDDRYELPLIVAGTQKELARWLGIYEAAVCAALQRSKDGVVHARNHNRGVKYFCMGAESGNIIRRRRKREAGG